MTQEDTNLLLRDLCARLPYGVKYVRDSWNYECDQEMSVVEVFKDIDKEGYINCHKVYGIWDIKPYLRPMSSMTEKEQSEFVEFHCVNLCPIIVSEMLTILQESKMLDWLNSHHFDFHGLIEKGLALEAPEGMYDIK